MFHSHESGDCILNKHQLQHDIFRTGSIKQPITWNQWSTLYFRASFCDSSICLFSKSVSPVIIGSKIRSLTAIVEGGTAAAPTRSERASALALSQLTPSGESFDLCSASKQKEQNGNWWSKTRGITFKIIKIWRRIYFPRSGFQRIAACIPRVKSYTSIYFETPPNGRW